MWALKNRTTYGAARNWIRDKNGVHHWLVAVKATFDIAAGGRVRLADQQSLPLLAPVHRGDPQTSSLRIDADLLAPKPGTDVCLDACAHAAKGRPAPIVPVSLRIAAIDKTLLVHGLRVYYRGARGPAMSSPRPFVTQPIHYEWAFGGTDTTDPDPRKHRIDARNPVGKGIAVDPASLENQPAHAIEYPRGDPRTSGPGGFGPIASFWSPRLERAGTYDARWEAAKKPLLPDDYDERFASSAPDDQRSTVALRGGEPVQLTNLTPGGELRFDLPRRSLAFVTRIAGRREEHAGTLASVFIATEEMKLSMIWQTTLKVRAREVDELDDTTIAEKSFLT